MSSSGSFYLNDESCSSDATVPVQAPGQGPEPEARQEAADGGDLRIALEGGDSIGFTMEVEVVDFLNTSNGPSTLDVVVSDVPPSSSSSHEHQSYCTDPSHTESCRGDHGMSIDGAGGAFVDVPDIVLAETDKKEEVPDPTSSFLTRAIVTPTFSTSEMRAEPMSPSDELLAAACTPSCLLAAVTLMTTIAGKYGLPTTTPASNHTIMNGTQSVAESHCDDTKPVIQTSLVTELFASPRLDASAVGFAVAFLSILSVCDANSNDNNNDSSGNDGSDLVRGLAPWLWSLMPLLRSSPSDSCGNEDNQPDYSDGPHCSQVTDVATSSSCSETDTTSSSSVSKRKGRQKTVTVAAGKEKAGKKNQKPNHKEQAQEDDSTRHGQKPAGNRRKRVQFCFVDGSSVQPPVCNQKSDDAYLQLPLTPSITSYIPQGKDCFCGPALRTARRLMSLIDQVDALVQEQGGQRKDLALQACQILAHSPSSEALAASLISTFSLGLGPCPRAGDMVAIASMLASELSAGLALVSGAKNTAANVNGSAVSHLSGTRTVLRHRAAWMATAVLRAQLRWLLDPPPQAISTSAAAVIPSSSSYSDNAQGADNGSNSSGARSRHWCDLHRFVLLKEAIPLPVYVPPPGNTTYTNRTDKNNSLFTRS